MKQTNNINNNKPYYMIFAHNSINNIKYIVHKEKEEGKLKGYSIHWTCYYKNNLFPFTAKRLAIAKFVAHRVQLKFGKVLKDIYISKIIPTDNEEGCIEEIVYTMKLNKFGHLVSPN